MKGKRKAAKQLMKKAAEQGKGMVIKVWKARLALQRPEPRMVLSPFYAWRAIYR